MENATKENKITVSLYCPIYTTYKGPTNTKGSRIIAKSSNGFKVTVPYDYSLNSQDRHAKAANELIAKFGWEGEWVGAEGEKGYVFICLKKG